MARLKLRKLDAQQLRVRLIQNPTTIITRAFRTRKSGNHTSLWRSSYSLILLSGLWLAIRDLWGPATLTLLVTAQVPGADPSGIAFSTRGPYRLIGARPCGFVNRVSSMYPVS